MHKLIVFGCIFSWLTLRLPLLAHQQLRELMAVEHRGDSTHMVDIVTGDWRFLKSHPRWEFANLFVIGEFHHVKSNHRVENSLYFYLASEVGMSDIIVEEGLATTFLLNRYITTGDNRLLEQYMTYPHSIQYYRSLRKLIVTKNIKPPTLHSVDLEDSPQNILLYIDHNTSSHHRVIRNLVPSFNKWREDKLDTRIISDASAVVLLKTMFAEYMQDSTYFDTSVRQVFHTAIVLFDEYELMRSTDFNTCNDTAMINLRERIMFAKMKPYLNDNFKALVILGSIHIPYENQKSNYLFRCPYEWKSVMSQLIDGRHISRDRVLSFQIVFPNKKLEQHFDALGFSYSSAKGALKRSNFIVQVLTAMNNAPFDFLIITR